MKIFRQAGQTWGRNNIGTGSGIIELQKAAGNMLEISSNAVEADISQWLRARVDSVKKGLLLLSRYLLFREVDYGLKNNETENEETVKTEELSQSAAIKKILPGGTGKKTGILIIGGDYPDKSVFSHFLDISRIVVAADSGFDTALALGIKPDYVAGDMDSCKNTEELSRFPKITLIFPKDKDDTDTEIGLIFFTDME